MIGKLAYAAGLLAASTAGGVALGGYTIGGFRIDQPTDTIAVFMADRSGPRRGYSYSYSGDAPALMTQAEPVHVCKGCDAKLYRDDPGRYDPSDYDQPAASENYRGYEAQPAQQDYATDEEWDEAITAYYHDDEEDDPPVTLATIG